ncbi:MAG: hypothetical protein KDB74_13190, partial [Flavobacteriales bacterium]|nr:hypothetical protein [Flavobacteriales bacterium]
IYHSRHTQNLYAMRVDEINERSVLLARQSSALTFKLFKFINAKRSFGYRWWRWTSTMFQNPHCA